jgi:hypothetical protein
MDIYNLSTPAYLYLIIALIGNVLSLFILPFNCSSIGIIGCIVILLLSILITLIFLYLITWAIDALYQSGYTVLSWILAIVVILFSLIDLGNVVGNLPSVSSTSSSTSDASTSDASTSDASTSDASKKSDITTSGTTTSGTITKGNITQGNINTSGFTENVLDIYSNPNGSYLGR